MRKLLILTIFLFGLFYATNAQAGIIIRPVHHFGLVGYWDFQEGQGTIANDHSGNSNHGTLMWMATSTPTGGWTDGKIGSGLEFDGESDYVNCGDETTLQGIDSDYSWTISLWYKSEDATSNEKGLLYKSQWVLNCSYLYGNNRCFFEQQTGDYHKAYSSVGSFSANVWQHIVVTGTGTASTIKFYINGVDQTATPDSDFAWEGAGAGDDDFRIAFGYDKFWDGQIDEVRVYNRALSAGEVARLYKLSQPTVAKGTSSTGLVGYWPFEEGTGTKVGDHSGNDNTMTFNNNPTWKEGKLGGALDFESDNTEYLYISDANLSAGFPGKGDVHGEVTLAAWVNIESLGPDDYALIAGKTDPDNFAEGYGLYINKGENKFYIRIVTSDGYRADRWDIPSIGQWHHLVGTYKNGDRARLYINGSLVPEGGIGSGTGDILGSTLAFAVAGNPDLSGFYDYDGLTDEVRVYNWALSASEVAALYKSGRMNVNTSQTDRLTDGLVGMWSFDGQDMADLTAFDRSGQDNHGTLTNGPQRTIGRLGQALEFDGGDDWVDVDDSDDFSITTTNKLTVSTWIKLNSFSVTQRVVSKHASGGYEWNIQANTNSTINIVAKNSVGGAYFENAYGISAGTWYHVAWVIDLDVPYAKLYVNGVKRGEDTTPTGTVASNGTSHLGIGRDGDGNAAMAGLIDEVRIYNRVLSPDEVKRLYNMGR